MCFKFFYFRGIDIFKFIIKNSIKNFLLLPTTENLLTHLNFALTNEAYVSIINIECIKNNNKKKRKRTLYTYS